MNLSQNETLTPQERESHHTVRNIVIMLSTVGMVIILAFFDNLPIAISSFAMIVTVNGYFTWQQIKYEQGKDLKTGFLFFSLSVVTALALWLSFIFI